MPRLLRPLAVLGLLLASAPPAFAQRDVRASAMPDFAAVAAANRGVGGFYLAGGLGYGSAAPRSFSITEGYACPGSGLALPGVATTAGGSGCAARAGLSGLSGHVIAGWNFVGPQGGLLTGIEARARLGRESGSARLGGSAAVALAGIPAYTNTASGSYQAAVEGGFSLSGRLGYAAGGVLPFVRAGLGLSKVAESVHFDATGARLCTLNPNPAAPITCTTGGVINDSRASWLPSAVIGAGLEIPMQRFFLRIDAEAEAIFQPSQDLKRRLAGQAVTTSVTGGLGGQTVAAAGEASLRSENWIVARRLMVSAGFRF